MRSGVREKRADDRRGKFAPARKAAPMGYAEMKAHFTRLVQASALARLPPLHDLPLRNVRAEFVWCEPNRRRDPDGVRAAAKFVFDGLVAARAIATDGVADVFAIRDDFAYGGRLGVWVKLIDDAGRAVVFDFAFRFPDLNEMLAAKGRDGALTERTRQAKRRR